MSLFSSLRNAGRCPSRVTCPASTGRPAGSTRRRSRRGPAAGRSCSSTSGPTPASTGCARSPTSAPGPRDTRSTGWSWSACTRPSSRSSATSTTSGAPRTEMRVEYPVALDSDYAVWQRVREPLLAGRLHRRRGGRDPRTTTSARAATRECEMVDPAPAARGRARGRPDDSSPSRPEGSRRRPTGTTWRRPRPTSATSAGAELRLARRRPSSTSPTPTRRPSACSSTSGRSPATGRSDAAGLRARAGRRAIAFRFHARDVHLVMGPPAPGAPVPFRVLVDGEPPGDAHGLDIDEQGNGTVVEQRLYQLIRAARTRSATARSRSRSSTPASRPTCSRSARR